MNDVGGKAGVGQQRDGAAAEFRPHDIGQKQAGRLFDALGADNQIGLQRQRLAVRADRLTQMLCRNGEKHGAHAGQAGQAGSAVACSGSGRRVSGSFLA